MTITGQSSLAKDDIERMVKDAEAHAEEDSRRREEAEARNQAENLVYQTEKLLKEQGDKLEGDDKTKVEDSLAALKTALDGDDVAEIKQATENLMTSSQDFTQKLYESAAQAEGDAAGAAGGAGATSADDDEVVDAEIVDEDE